MFETALRTEGQRRLAEIGQADVLVGIPTYRNATTIAQVVDTAVDGLRTYFPTRRSVIAIVDGGSSDETVETASSRPLPPSVSRIVTTYQGIPGKGSAVRAILEMTRVTGARVCIVLEADLVSLSRDWVFKLAAPILDAQFDFALPAYAQPLVESAVNDLLVHPMTRLLYDVEVRYPVADDFAIGRDFAIAAHERDVWETDVARHGIDVWLTTIALNENVRMCQVPLGVKMEHKREAAVALDPSFVQSVGTLFRMLDIYRRRWHEPQPVRQIPFCGEPPVPRATRLTGEITLEMLSAAFVSGTRRYRRLWRAVMMPSNLEAVLDLFAKPRGATRFPPDLWARVVFDFAVVYNKGENDPDKVAAGLLPLYYARIATILRETNGKLDAVERAIRAQAQCFVDQKAYLLQRWETYVPWAVDGVR